MKMAAQKVVVGGSSVTALQLKDLFRQIADGSLDGGHVQAMLEHKNPFEKSVITTFDPAAFIRKGWLIVDDNEKLPENWNPKTATTRSALKSGEPDITGVEAGKRLKDQKLLGAKAFLHFWNNQADIPEEWRGKLIFFDATVLQSPRAGRYTLCLFWGGRWWTGGSASLDDPRRAQYLSACAN